MVDTVDLFLLNFKINISAPPCNWQIFVKKYVKTCFHTNCFVAHRYFVKNLSLNDNIFRYMSTSLNPPFVLSPTAVLYDSKCTPHFHKKLIHVHFF